jgi:Cu/Ag efflux protein CusF
MSVAQMDHSAHAAPTAKPAMSEGAMEQGVVKKVDKASGKVSVAHEAQKGGMPAMTMMYKIKDTAVLEKLQVGQKIRFAADPADSSILVRVEPLK